MKEENKERNSKSPEIIQKAFRIVFPVIAGLFVNILMLLLMFLIAGNNISMSQEYKHFILYYSHICIIIALLFQAFIVSPLFCRYQFKTTTERTIGWFALFLVSVFGGFIFAFIVSTTASTHADFITNFLFGFVFAFIYLLTCVVVMDKVCMTDDSEDID
ncbi:hypothetical protein DSECCO2_487400 [anaerobic digester metagenome]